MTIKRIFLLLCLLFFSTSFYAQKDSLREKIGQMLIIGFQGKTINDQSTIAHSIKEDNIGGVILFDFNQQTQTFDKNIESPQQLKQLNQQLQAITQKANKAHHRNNLPLLITIDYEGGQVNRLHPNYGFPEIASPKKIGTGSLQEAKRSAELMANTMKLAGINLDFFPNLDLDVNPENPIIGKKERSFSADPDKVVKFAQIYSQQFKTHHILCVYKHFPGHGSSLADSHLGFVDLTDTWKKEELKPFIELLNQPDHCNAVMIAHIVNRQLDATGAPASLSQTMITDLLRHQLKFDGVVITDDLQMKAIADNYGLADALTRSINAGADMLIFGNQLGDKSQDPKELIAIIEEKVHSGQISEQRINEAYQHIMKMKQELP